MRDRDALRAFARDYRFANLLRSLTEARSPDLWRRMLARLEREDFLASQADRPGGFEAGAEQLESHVLPALIDLGDWERYCRYMATAVHLRAVADLLDDPSILRALARGGRRDLAEAAVARLTHPTNRVRGWAALAVEAPSSSPCFARAIEAIVSEAERMTPEALERDRELAVHWSRALAWAGRRLTVALRARWMGWIGPLAPRAELADDVRAAVVEGFFDAEEPEAPELWAIASSMQDPRRLRRVLPERSAGACRGEPRRWLTFVRDRLAWAEDDPALLWAIGLVLAANCEAHPAAGWSWLRATLPPARWSRDLLERGAGLWPRLDDGVLAELAAELGRAGSVTRLQTLLAEGRGDAASCRAAIESLRLLQSTQERTSLYLRVLLAASPESLNDLGPRVERLLAHLAEVQFALPPEDLRRALDLVARHLTRRLRGTLDCALAAAASGPATVRTLTDRTLETGVLDELLARAERHAATVATNAAEGFELRREILGRLALRRLAADLDVEAFDRAVQRLLPDEEDGLRAEAAGQLGGSAPGIAREVFRGIRDHRLRLRLELSIGGSAATPTAIYRAAARREALDDELRALGSLLESPRRPARVSEAWLAQTSSPVRRIEALLDLALHALLYQERHLPARLRDRAAALAPLKEALGVVESDDWLVSLAPELVTIGGRCGLREARAEVQEAFVKVVGVTTVPWERREEALLSIVGRLPVPFRAGGPRPPRRHVTRLVAWIVRMPERMAETPGVDDLRRGWFRLLPAITALAERCDGALPAALRTVLGDSCRHGSEWTPERSEVFDLCLAPSAERAARADRWIAAPRQLTTDRAQAEEVRALAWLLAGAAPDRLVPLLGRLPAGPERDRSIAELLRNAPLPDDTARQIVSLLGRGDAGDWGLVWAGVRSVDSPPEAEWVGALAALVARDAVDPGDPRTMPIRRRLWTVTREESLRTLARAAVRALGHGGPAAGERALRLFLAAFVRPSPGEEAPAEARRRHDAARRALDEARALENGYESPASNDEGSDAGRLPFEARRG